MDTQAMEPFGRALLAYYHGNADAEVLIRRDDGQVTPLPVNHFFRAPAKFTPIEKTALALCRGSVLDAGAGTGSHSLYLQQNGLAITAIDICTQAVEIMKLRGISNVHLADIFTYASKPVDTLLTMGHGIGLVQTIDGLQQLLARLPGLLTENGQVVLDSVDVRKTADPVLLAYHEANRKAGRYIGEVRLQFEFQGKAGPWCGWLHIDAETLTKYAQPAGWQCVIIQREKSGDYLAQLTPKK